MNQYVEMKNRHQKEVNDFPMMFAFSNDQFAEGMAEWGYTPEDTDKIYSIGAGGYIRRKDSEKFNALFDRIAKETEEAVNADKTGDGFIYQMFRYELTNHEFIYTEEVDETLDALGYTMQDINENPALKHGLKKAVSEILKSEEYEF